MRFPILTTSPWRKNLAALILPLIVAACYPAPSPPPTPIQEAAKYDWLIAEQRYSEPVDAWVRNKPLERFLQKAFSSGGLEALKSQYGFDCAPRAVVPPCSNCQVCRATLSMRLGDQPITIGAAHGMGPMLIHLDIGPGSDSFSAMTYWERLPSGKGK
jgi:hypothetical protein